MDRINSDRGAAMKSVYKYPLSITHRQTVSMPTGAKILSVQMQGETLCVWALVDVDIATTEDRVILVFGTGQQFSETPMEHLATVQSGEFVWHIFEDHCGKRGKFSTALATE